MRNSIEKYLGPEDRLQIAVCQYLRLQYKQIIIHHSPNEGKRGHVQQYKIKHMGVSSGFPDLLIIYKKKIIAVELKAGKNKATKNQLEWIDILVSIGIPAKVCTGFDETKAFVDPILHNIQ